MVLDSLGNKKFQHYTHTSHTGKWHKGCNTFPFKILTVEWFKFQIAVRILINFGFANDIILSLSYILKFSTSFPNVKDFFPFLVGYLYFQRVDLNC